MPHVLGLYSPVMGSGKTTLANTLQGHGYVRLPFAAPLKSMLRALLIEAGVKPYHAHQMTDGPLKESSIPELGGLTPRHALQTLGTEWGRTQMHPDFWVQIWTARARRELAAGRSVVSDDMRFPNEAAAITALGGLTVQIIRPAPAGASPTGVPGHASEGSLASYPFDLTIENTAQSAIQFALDAAVAVGKAQLSRATS